MKKYIKIAVLGVVILASASCKKFLDVNTNPNNPTYSTPNIVLPQAILTASNTTASFDGFGAWVAGYKSNAGGYGAFGAEWTYEYTTNNYAAMWSDSFSGINQLNFVIDNTTATGPLKFYNAMARVMKNYLYARLVDQYGDVPYSDAGKGTAKLSPKYDKYSDVYKAVYADLDACIAVFNSGAVTNVTTPVTAAQDPLFGGSVAGNAKWIQLANTIKLKMLIRAQKASELASWVTTSKASLPTTTAGYLTDDALVNPGFTASNGSQFNSRWSSYGWSTTGVGQNLTQLPTPWIVSFYDGTKLSDEVRGKAIYNAFGTTVTQIIGQQTISFTGPATNQLGYDVDPVKRSVAGTYWYSGIGRASRPTSTTANGALDVGGVLKGATAGQPIFLATEVYFLLAEAALPSVNIVNVGAPQALYESGITASFNYLYKNAANTYFNATPAATLKNNYIALNANKYIVKFDTFTDAGGATSPTTEEQKLEAIITQKYIALNFLFSEEGYNEFRRTGYPRIVPGSTVATETFVSLKAPNNYPARVLYPAVEFQVNSANVPKGVTTKTKIFYAK